MGRKGEALSGRNLSAEEDVRCKRTSPRAHLNIESNQPSLKKKNILSAGERGVHPEGQHDGEDHRLWDGQGARARDGHQGALRDSRVCRS